MHIRTIKIENFKGFASKALEFNEQFTVLIGDNGNGKTSILDAVSIAIGTVLMKTNSKFSFGGRNSRPLLKEEIRKIAISPDNIELTNVSLEGEFEFNSKRISWKRVQSINSSSLNYKESAELIKVGENIVKNISKPIDIPLFVHHTTARLWGNMYEKNNKYETTGSRLEGYYACLDSRNIKEKFISWFKTYEDEVLKFNKDKSLYTAFTNSITAMVSDWKKIHYSWALDDILGETEGEQWLSLKNLSDGYKSIVNLTADIAYRAIKLNPHLGEDAVTKTKGIVLIDEIDMHLHPKWQKHVIEDLKKTFPNIQFIATTHSPFIVQSLKANEVINLDGRKLSENPDDLTIEENALFMGVTDDNSLKFERKEKLAKEYLGLLKNENPSADALGKLEKLLLEFSDDPVFIAKLKLEKELKFHP